MFYQVKIQERMRKSDVFCTKTGFNARDEAYKQALNVSRSAFLVRKDAKARWWHGHVMNLFMNLGNSIAMCYSFFDTIHTSNVHNYTSCIMSFESSTRNSYICRGQEKIQESAKFRWESETKITSSREHRFFEWRVWQGKTCDGWAAAVRYTHL